MSGYERLDEYLDGYGTSRVTLHFEQVESILGAALPEAARLSRDWWFRSLEGGFLGLWESERWEVEAAYPRSGIVTFSKRGPG